MSLSTLKNNKSKNKNTEVQHSEVEIPGLRDSHSRSFLKGVSWRAIASLTTVLVAWLVTGDTKIALEIGAIEVVAKIFIYYLHERIWVSL